MSFTDLDEELNGLGFGNLWNETVLKLAATKKAINETDLQRLKKYNEMYPERHKQAIRKWVKNKYNERKQLVKDRVGVDKCVLCDKLLTRKQLIWQSEANPMTCANCKRKLKGKKNE